MRHKPQNEQPLFTNFSDLPNLSKFCIHLLDTFQNDESFSINVNRSENIISFSFLDKKEMKEVSVTFSIQEEDKNQ